MSGAATQAQQSPQGLISALQTFVSQLSSLAMIVVAFMVWALFLDLALRTAIDYNMLGIGGVSSLEMLYLAAAYWFASRQKLI